MRLARFLSDPQRSLDQLDRFSRLWPVSACFGAFGFVAARSAMDGHGSAALIYGALTTVFLGLLVWLLRLYDEEPPGR